MSVFGAPILITLPAASTSEVTGTLPANTKAVKVVCVMNAPAAFQFPSYSVGFATGTGTQMAGGVNPGYRTTGGTQQGNAQWSNAAIGFATQGNVATARTITVTTMSGTNFGLTKDGSTHADVLCLVYPVVTSGTCDLREGTSLNTGGGTALTATGLTGIGALVLLTTTNGANGFTAVPRLSLGFATSAATRWGVAIAQDWNANPSNVVSRVRTNLALPAYINQSNLANYPTGHLDVGSLSATGYTIVQNASTVTTNRFAVLAIPGEFALLTGSVPSSTGAQANTSAPWRPSSAWFALSAFTTANDTQADSFSLSLGGGTVATHRCGRIQNPDNTATPQPTVADVAGVMQGANASGQTSLATLQSFDANGLTLNWTDADPTAGLWAALVSREAVSAPGFRPYFIA